MTTVRPRRPDTGGRSRRPGRDEKRAARKRVLRKVVESDKIRSLDADTYRRETKSLYDGPAGAMLSIGSRLSLHEPLVGRMIRNRKFDVTRFRSILDLGSGAGQILGHLVGAVESGTRVVACDLSDQMLQRAARRVNSDVPEYLAADMTRLPFADETFDAVTCGYVIEHLDDPRPGLREIRRVLKPGGRMLLIATEDSMLGAFVSMLWKCRTYNRAELREHCAEVGLPWAEELWFTRPHAALKMGGILVEAERGELPD